MSMIALQQGPKGVAEHGQHIFVYCNIRTKQVIYSLDRAMNVSTPPYHHPHVFSEES